MWVTSKVSARIEWNPLRHHISYFRPQMVSNFTKQSFQTWVHRFTDRLTFSLQTYVYRFTDRLTFSFHYGSHTFYCTSRQTCWPVSIHAVLESIIWPKYRHSNEARRNYIENTCNQWRDGPTESRGISCWVLVKNSLLYNNFVTEYM